MMMHHTSPHAATSLGRILFATVLLALGALPVAATTQLIPPTTPTTSISYLATTTGDTYILSAANTHTYTGNGEAVTLGNTSGTFNLVIDGSLISTANGARAVRGANNNSTFNVTVGVAGLIQAFNEDAIQARNGIFNVTNNGTIYSGSNLASTPVTASATGQALDLASATGGTVINNGLIRADGHDAVRLGSNTAMTNTGTVRTNGLVNDNSANNVFNTSPNNSVAQTFSANDGVSFENGANSSLTNSGLITASRHGVETDVSATNITLTNLAGGTIIGRNGSGFGSDATSAVAANITVNNSGVIRGDFAGVGNVVDRTGNASFTQDGDGDGVDIDGAGTVNNFAGGQILGTGANGFDTGGRANTADGISLGGGIVNNSGLIQGAGVGIVVNNDTTASRSGVAATTITNNAGGTIEGLNGYAIRLENKLGDARDNDTITNAGTIIGRGAIPLPGATVILQNGAVDTNSSGTLDGSLYNGTGSARFIKGDGSAIQMGEGNDVLNNSGTITGQNSRAINMEGGNDTINVTGGAINGSINGGAGTDRLAFNLGSPTATFVQNGAITNFEQVEITSGNVQLRGNLNLGANSNALTVQNGGILNLDNSILTLDRGSVVLNGTLKIRLNSDYEYGVLIFAGTNLGGLTLTGTSVLDLDLGYTPLVGDQFTLAEFGGGNPFLTGTFAGLSEGAFFVQEGYQFQISYQGNGGHDIVITRTVPDTGATLAFLAAGLALLGLAGRRFVLRT